MKYAIEWNAVYDRFYWGGGGEMAWGSLRPEPGDLFKPLLFDTLDEAERGLPKAARSRDNVRIVQVEE